MPNPIRGESRKEFIARYMSSDEAQRSFPKGDQRFAVANSLWKTHSRKVNS